MGHFSLDSLASELPFAFLKSKLKCPIINLFLSCTNPLAALRPAHGSRGFKRGYPFAQWAFLAVACHCVKKTPY